MYIGYVAAQRRNHKEKEERRCRVRHGPAAAFKDLPQLRRVRPWGEGSEEDSSLIDKLGKGISAVFSAEDVIEGEVIAE